MKNYVTLFNSKYLPQGLSLYESLKKNSKNFRLWILCIDDICYEILKKLNLENINLIKLSDVEDTELLEVKKDRTIGEYCWTLTPFSVDFVFLKDQSIDEVTYLDADLYFLNQGYLNIFQELNSSKKSALITRHAYSPEYDQSSSSGIYCVQFIIFKRTESRVIREKWQKQCIEWCFNRVEDNKFGDQKYLDDWPYTYPDLVHVLNKESLIMGPWNSTRFPYSDASVWHFHGLRIGLSDDLTHMQININQSYKIPEPTLKNIYMPYIESLNRSISILNNIGFTISAQ